MADTIEVVDVIKNFVNNDLDFTLEIVSFSDDGTNTTIIVENPFHARKQVIITIDTVPLEIISVSGNDIVVPGQLTPLVAILATPFYINGTPIAANTELNNIKKNKNKTPMIYLHEIISTEYFNNPLARIDKIPHLRIFFLDESKKGDWKTEQHYSKVIVRMRRVFNLFIEQLNLNQCTFGEFDNYVDVIHNNWGEWKEHQGHIKTIFDKDLSGIELIINLPILKTL